MMAQSMAQSMTRSSMGPHTPSPMLASMNVPQFLPQDSMPSSSTIKGNPHSNEMLTPGPSHEEMVTQSSSHPEMMPPGASHEEVPSGMMPEDDQLHTSISQKRYIFDDEYTQIEQSYRETRQPITMPEAVPEPGSKPVDTAPGVMGQSLPGMLNSMTGVSSMQGLGGMMSLSEQHHPNLMSMSTMDASFMSASPYLEHSQWAARSSLSQGKKLKHGDFSG